MRLAGYQAFDSREHMRELAAGQRGRRDGSATQARVEASARAHEKRQASAAAVIASLEAHAARIKRARGVYVGGPAPYGFAVGELGDLVHVEEEQYTISYAQHLRAEGRSLRAVARALAERDMLARNGLPFSAEQLRRIIAAAECRDSYLEAARLAGVA